MLPSTRGPKRSRHGYDVLRVLRLDQPQELAECVLFHDRIAKREIAVNAIHVAAPAASALDVPGILEVAKDAVGVTLCDRGSRCDLPHADFRPPRDGKQHLGVIRDERPAVR